MTTQVNDETKPEETPEQERKRVSAVALNRHLALEPDAVIVASVKDGQITVDITPFEQIPSMVMTAKLLELYVEDTLKRSMAAQQQTAGLEKLKKASLTQ